MNIQLEWSPRALCLTQGTVATLTLLALLDPLLHIGHIASPIVTFPKLLCHFVSAKWISFIVQLFQNGRSLNYTGPPPVGQARPVVSQCAGGTSILLQWPSCRIGYKTLVVGVNPVEWQFSQPLRPLPYLAVGRCCYGYQEAGVLG